MRMTTRSALRKTLKISAILVAGVCIFFLAAFAWYVIQYYPRKAEPYEINTADMSPRILIATQGSEFKKDLVSGLGEELKQWPAYVRVMDVGGLDEVEIGNWQKIIILNTAMMNRLDSNVRRFIPRVRDRDDVLLIVTSGGADYKPDDLRIDAISGASRMADIDRLAGMIVDWMGKEGSFARNPDDHVLAMEYFLQVDIEAACAGVLADPGGYLDLYPNLENRLNAIGYDLVKRSRLDDALVVFCLNKGLFKDSWNAYDSYAEALLANGEIEAALANYRKSLDLNPANENGKKILKELESRESG